MKRLFLYIFFVSYCISSLFSQTAVIGSGSMQSKTQSNNKSEEKEIETFEVSIKCYYSFSQKDKEGQLIRVDTMALLIGDNKSKFYNPAKYERDSIFSSIMNNLDPRTIQSISVLKDGSAGDLSNGPGKTSASSSNDGESYQIFKERAKSSLLYIDYTEMPSQKYKYEDKVADLSWKISQDTSTILGYDCQKATVNFRGREYTSWFSSEIPINDGPWKFMGLPGLILKINDTNSLFCYELVGIENFDSPVSIEIPKTRYDCTRKQFEGLKKKQAGGMQINVNGGNIIIAPASGHYNYNPIELESK